MVVTELQPWHTNAEKRGIIGVPNNAIISEKQIAVYCYKIAKCVQAGFVFGRPPGDSYPPW
jgi:hypothetical protein